MKKSPWPNRQSSTPGRNRAGLYTICTAQMTLEPPKGTSWLAAYRIDSPSSPNSMHTSTVTLMYRHGAPDVPRRAAATQRPRPAHSALLVGVHTSETDLLLVPSTTIFLYQTYFSPPLAVSISISISLISHTVPKAVYVGGCSPS